MDLSDAPLFALDRRLARLGWWLLVGYTLSVVALTVAYWRVPSAPRTSPPPDVTPAEWVIAG